MNFFKEIIYALCPVTSFSFGFGIGELVTGDYKNAAWCLFVSAIFYLVGYLTERLSD
jgi:hypothetical protein